MSKETKKSDTHDERYAHVPLPEHPRVYMATVFARKEGLYWWYAVALCARGDQFSRRIGRQIARRKYFAEGRKTLGLEFNFEAAVGAAFNEALTVRG